MGKVAFVNSQDAFRLHRPVQTIESARVEIASLVVHAAHDGVWGVHNTAHYEAGTRRGQKV